jgi:hypothetical protein
MSSLFSPEHLKVCPKKQQRFHPVLFFRIMVGLCIALLFIIACFLGTVLIAYMIGLAFSKFF